MLAGKEGIDYQPNAQHKQVEARLDNTEELTV